MSFWDKLKQQAGTAAKTAAQQTKTVASIGRVKLAIASEEDKIKKAYTEVGRLFYRDYEVGVELSMDDYQVWCDKISDAKGQIVLLNEELERLRTASPAEEEPEVAIEAGLSEEPPEAEAESVAEGEAPEAGAESDPTVGTLYVDVSNPEE